MPKTSTKRKATVPPTESTAAAAVTPSPSKKPKTKEGLSGCEAPDVTTTEQGNIVDSGVSFIDPSVASRVKVHETHHACLALVDISVNSDIFYILQVLVDVTSASFYLFTRWGRRGTSGQAQLEEHQDQEAVQTAFEKSFHAKVGVEWSKAIQGAVPMDGKYEYLSAAQPSDEKAGWFYYLVNDPLGKPNGWYQYDLDNREEVEQLFSEYASSGCANRLSTRFIYSESSKFTYAIDLVQMVQTNIVTSMTRPICRTEDGKPPTKDPPSVTATTARNYSTVNPARNKASAALVVSGAVDNAASPMLQNGGVVYDNYDAMLNQTNIGNNNNKFYKLQLIQVPNQGIFFFTRWGRVGETGQTQEKGPFGRDAQAIKEFDKKFKSKTGNKWDDRANFLPKKGKYTLVEMETDKEAANAMVTAASAAAGSSTAPVSIKIKPCMLDPATMTLVDLIFDRQTFHTAMSAMNIDPAKLPLGALSKTQISKGFSVLEELEAAIDKEDNKQDVLTELTSQFYTVIPHAFGRRRGPILNTKQMVADKYGMLNMLTDIEEAQEMQREVQQSQAETTYQDHPSDLNYQQLRANLTLVDNQEGEYALIESYFKDTQASSSRMKLRNVWKVDRHNESERFEQHKELKNRKLLWHGTNVAVVAAILKSGLRIMPHSGGRVGQGIYLADQHAKSEWYVQSSKGTTIMFLVETALGKEHVITRDDPSLKQAPAGHDSVLALGRCAPSKATSFSLDGNAVQVPSGKPEEVAGAENSFFHHNEFLIYQESQHRIRYVLAFDS